VIARLIAFAFVLLFSCTARAETPPLGKGLPINVRVAVYFADIHSIDENEGEFVATLDVRLRWDDSRLRYPAKETPRGFVELRNGAAAARIAEIWTPDVDLANIVDEPLEESRGLRIYPDGRVELMVRTKARFQTGFDFERFPFDRQELTVELVASKETNDVVVLDYRQDDLNFTRLAESVRLEGWTPGLIDFERAPLTAWYGELHARVQVSLQIVRQAGKSVPTIFIPLFASLFIPLLSMWLNKVENGEFKVEAFELANIVIGGLFAVIALNFTVGAEYPALSSADNTVARLFGLNYISLAASLVINLVLFRFNLVMRLFGRHVQEQLYRYLIWALPLLAMSTATAIVLVAMA
jgi:hypothetical protein